MNAYTKSLGGAVLGLILAAGLVTPSFAAKLDNGPGTSTTTTTAPAATANADIDFGDDSSEWAKDGECDDPRFTGTGSAAETLDADTLKDATDCKAAYEAGTVTLKDAAATTSPADIAIASPIDAIDFGDDSSEWAKDGECDDPRFAGAGSAAETLDADIRKDATDCRAAYEAGTVTLKDSSQTTTTTTAPVANTEIDFGDDSSEWAKDGECDDPRFTGTGSAAETIDADILKDATDCKAAYDAGTVALVGATDTPVVAAEIDYGDDASEWNNDGECDDPRFAGTGVAGELLDADLGHDATDCRAAVAAGTATFVGGASTTPVAALDYGDDTSEWAKDGECDDPRFSGTGVAGELLDADIGHDATDCRAAVEAGTATFNGGAATTPVGAFDYGTDSSVWANDNECDDLRFIGAGVDKKLLADDLMGDATDCRAAVDAGTASIRTVYTPEYAAAAPHDASGITFGDNSSDYANNDECDDPRFEGPGAASVLLESDQEHDSADCEAAFIAGRIVLKGSV